MASTEGIKTRPFVREDVAELLELMRGLARFEDYIDDFRVEEDDLVRFGLGAEPRFEAYVAQDRGQGPLLGMAVLYRIPWTYDLRPTLILKELYVHPDHRGRRVGEALMQHVARRASEIDCPRVGWTVLKSNVRGAAFYRRIGAEKDGVWDSWGLNEAAIRQLCDGD